MGVPGTIPIAAPRGAAGEAGVTKAEAAALAASVAGSQADAGVVVMPDANAPAATLPKLLAAIEDWRTR